MCPVLDEVVGPDVVRALRPEPNTKPVVQPKSPLLSLLLWDLQPFTSSLAIVLGPMADNGSPFDPFVVHTPACVVQQTRHHAISIAAIFVGQLDDIVGKTLFVGAALRCVDRCWPSVRQARRSDTPSSWRTWSMHLWRREGLRSFPVQPQSE